LKGKQCWLKDGTLFTISGLHSTGETGTLMPRITESEIAEVLIDYLNEKTSERASIKELVREIPNRVNLSAEDLAQSPTRPNEAIWEQQVRNITSHKKSPGNAIYEGKLAAIPGGLTLPGREVAA
jgi:hypothetical protein